MDSDDDYLFDATDSGNESPEAEESDGGMQDEVDDFGIDMDPEPGSSTAQKIEEEYIFEVGLEGLGAFLTSQGSVH
jgi:hypothetical protein